MTDLELPIIPASLLRQRAEALADGLVEIPCISLKRKGRKARAYGPAHGCTTCRKPPRYRNSWIVDCSCGAPPNPSAPVVLVRFVGDAA
jgi:hypothetical protein